MGAAKNFVVNGIAEREGAIEVGLPDTMWADLHQPAVALLALSQHLLCVLALGHVDEHGDAPDDLALGVALGEGRKKNVDGLTAFGDKHVCGVDDLPTLQELGKGDGLGMRARFGGLKFGGRASHDFLARVAHCLQPHTVHVEQPALAVERVHHHRRLFEERPEPRLALPELLRGAVPLGDIARDGDKSGLRAQRHTFDDDFHRKGRSIPLLTQPFLWASSCHLRVARLRVLGEHPCNIFAVLGRQQFGDRGPTKLFGGGAVHAPGGGIRIAYYSTLVDRENAVAGGFEDRRQALEMLLSRFLRGPLRRNVDADPHGPFDLAIRVAKRIIRIGEHHAAEIENVGELLAGEHPSDVAHHLRIVTVDIEDRSAHPVGRALAQRLQPLAFGKRNRSFLVDRPQHDRRVVDHGAQAGCILDDLALQLHLATRKRRGQGFLLQPQLYRPGNRAVEVAREHQHGATEQREQEAHGERYRFALDQKPDDQWRDAGNEKRVERGHVGGQRRRRAGAHAADHEGQEYLIDDDAGGEEHHARGAPHDAMREGGRDEQAGAVLELRLAPVSPQGNLRERDGTDQGQPQRRPRPRNHVPDDEGYDRRVEDAGDQDRRLLSVEGLDQLDTQCARFSAGCSAAQNLSRHERPLSQPWRTSPLHQFSPSEEIALEERCRNRAGRGLGVGARESASFDAQLFKLPHHLSPGLPVLQLGR